MNGVSAAIASWLERKRRAARVSAAVLSLLALGGGSAVFLVIAVLIYTPLAIACGVFARPAPWVGLAALGLTTGFFARVMKARLDQRELVFDPLGMWVFKDIGFFGPRLLREGFRQVRCWGLFGELNVAACAQALTYLAAQNAAVTCDELMGHCPQISRERLMEQLALLDGVLLLGEETFRVTLMEPFRLRLRRMLEPEHRAERAQEPRRSRPRPPPPAVPVNEPEKLSAYEILGLSPSASAAEIKLAYRKRMKECHPDLFAGMDQQAKALAERWTKALNAAYATLNPRHRRE